MNTSILTLPLRVPLFTIWFLKEMVVSSFAVIKDAVRPGSDATPRVVRLPVEGSPDWHVVLISMLITLTPGTLTLGTAPAEGDLPPGLLVHSMYHPDTDSAVADVDDMFQRMRRALAVGGDPT